MTERAPGVLTSRKKRDSREVWEVKRQFPVKMPARQRSIFPFSPRRVKDERLLIALGFFGQGPDRKLSDRNGVYGC